MIHIFPNIKEFSDFLGNNKNLIDTGSTQDLIRSVDGYFACRCSCDKPTLKAKVINLARNAQFSPEEKEILRKALNSDGIRVKLREETILEL